MRERAKSDVLAPPCDFRGLEWPLLLTLRPGLDQPPSGVGDGLRDRDMLTFGVPKSKGKGARRKRENGSACVHSIA